MGRKRGNMNTFWVENLDINPNDIGFILIWFCITRVFEETNNKKKTVMCIYMMTYMLQIFKPELALTAFIIMIALLYISVALFDDELKCIILKKEKYKWVDFLFRMITEYYLEGFCIGFYFYHLGIRRADGIGKAFIIFSIFVMYKVMSLVAAEAFQIFSFQEMKYRMDKVISYREFRTLPEKKHLSDEKMKVVISIEDKSYFERDEEDCPRYTLFNSYYLTGERIKKGVKKIFKLLWNESLTSILNWMRHLRGYSTIEMQIVRSLGIKNGYESHKIKRKIFEIIYSHLYIGQLKKYYQNECTEIGGAPCKADDFKEFLLMYYLRMAPWVGVTTPNDGDEKIEKVFGRPRENIGEYTKEELFVLTLCFSGKIFWGNILLLYKDIIIEQNLDKNEIEDLISKACETAN